MPDDADALAREVEERCRRAGDELRALTDGGWPAAATSSALTSSPERILKASRPVTSVVM